MRYFIYLLEFIGIFVAIFLLNLGLRYLFSKKFNDVTTVIFSFLTTIFVAFILSPYILSFPNPALFYLPISIGFLIKDLHHIINSRG